MGKSKCSGQIFVLRASFDKIGLNQPSLHTLNSFDTGFKSKTA